MNGNSNISEAVQTWLYKIHLGLGTDSNGPYSDLAEVGFKITPIAITIYSTFD